MLRTKRSFLSSLITSVVMLGIGASSSSAEDFIYGVDDYVVYSDGNISFRERTTLSGNVGSTGNMNMREDSVYSGGNLFSGSWMYIRYRTTISGMLIADGNVDVQNDADVAGEIYCDGRLTVNSRGRLRSDAYATGSISVNQNAVIDGDLFEDVDTLPNTWVELNVSEPSFNSGSTDVTVSNSQTQAIVPGDYGDLRLLPGSTVQLSAGSYHFAGAQIDQDVTFEIDDSAGPVQLFMGGNLNARERFEVSVASGEVSGFTLWVEGNLAFREDLEFTGRVRVFGNVSLRERTDFTGSIYVEGNFSGREDSSFKSAALAPVFYVRRRGSDGNDGRSPATAFRTIQRGVSSCIVAGSVVYVGPGVYQEDVDIGTGAGSDAVSGTDIKPIRLIADALGAYTNDSPGAVVLDGRASDPNGFNIESRLYWSIDGFEIANQRDYAIRAINSGLDVLNCTIDVPALYAVFMTAMGDVRVEDCVFERSSDSLHSIWIQPMNRNESTSVTVTRNDMTLKGGAYHSSGYEGGWSWSRGTRYSYGIVVFGWNSPAAVEIEISNNQVSDSYLPIYSAITNSPSSSSLVANNTVISSFYSIYSYMNNGGSSLVVNNIIDTAYYGLLAYGYRSDAPRIEKLLETGITYSMARYNRPFELDIITGDPLYVDAPAGDFSLAGGSPAIDSGSNQYAVSVDIDGRSRPSDGDADGIPIVDLGAYEKTNARTRVRVVRWREIGVD